LLLPFFDKYIHPMTVTVLGGGRFRYEAEDFEIIMII
jgi:hypothetical protein